MCFLAIISFFYVQKIGVEKRELEFPPTHITTPKQKLITSPEEVKTKAVRQLLVIE
jgi:hypothetical protein